MYGDKGGTGVLFAFVGGVLRKSKKAASPALPLSPVLFKRVRNGLGFAFMGVDVLRYRRGC